MDQLSLPSEPDQDFERLASALRADSRDLSTFLEVMASKFQGALPGRARVEYQGGLLRRSRQVRRVTLQLGDDRFELDRERGAIFARRTRVVRGIALKTEQLGVEDWLAELSHCLVREGRSSAQDRIALERLLG
ncbi:MAG: hypothetical protein WBU92_03170 [Candidatus Dormiibacterota bacterium]